MPTAAELPVSALLDLGLPCRNVRQGRYTSSPGYSPAASNALWQLALGNLVARTQASPFSVYAALSSASAESGGWDAAVRVAREGPLMTPLQPALQECQECRIALLRQCAPPVLPAAAPPRARSPICDLRLEEIVLADLRHAGMCQAAAAMSVCSVRRGVKRQRLDPQPLAAAPPAPAVPAAAPALPHAPRVASAISYLCEDDEGEFAEEEEASAGSDESSGNSCGDDDLEDDAQSTSPTFSFQAWPGPRRGTLGRAGSAESVSGGLDCGQSCAQA